MAARGGRCLSARLAMEAGEMPWWLFGLVVDGCCTQLTCVRPDRYRKPGVIAKVQEWQCCTGCGCQARGQPAACSRAGGPLSTFLSISLAVSRPVSFCPPLSVSTDIGDVGWWDLLRKSGRCRSTLCRGTPLPGRNQILKLPSQSSRTIFV
jgi:hypothetical protein